MNPAETGVLLVDWENLTGAIIDRGYTIKRKYVDDLWAFANRRCGGGQLHYSHMAAAKFGDTISAAMREHLIKEELVRSTKEQADIVLTVLAMDYLHQGIGKFVLVTGDQDFIPLIWRLHRDGRDVTVIYGDPSRLSPELRKVLSDIPGLESIDIADVTVLETQKIDTGCRSLLGLLELQRRGFILGGKEKGDRATLLAQWRILDNHDEDQYWSLIKSMTEKVARKDAAVRIDGDWLPRTAMRTYLDLTVERLADITAIDYAVRRISARPLGLTAAGLRTGPLQTDNGVMLGRVLDALYTVQIVRKGADDAFSMSGQEMPLGYLEPVWRVFAGLTAECYRRQVTSIPYGHVAPLLTRKGIGQGPDQRTARRVTDTISYARSTGIIDVISVDRARHAMVTGTSLSRQFELIYRELYDKFSTRIDKRIPIAEVMDFMESHDSNRPVPLFGFDKRDHDRVLRVLRQSQLIQQDSENMTLLRSAWGDALAT